MLSRLIIKRNINTLQEALRVLKLHDSSNIDSAAIKNQYYGLSKELHPDRNAGQDTSEAFHRLKLAYEFAIEHTQNNVFNSPHQQTAPRSRVPFGKVKFQGPQTIKKTKDYSKLKESDKDMRWVPKEGLPKSRRREVPKSTYGLTDEHKYVKAEKGQVDYRKPKQLPKWKDGNTFFDAHTKNFDD